MAIWVRACLDQFVRPFKRIFSVGTEVSAWKGRSGQRFDGEEVGSAGRVSQQFENLQDRQSSNGAERIREMERERDADAVSDVKDARMRLPIRFGRGYRRKMAESICPRK
eukprot:4634513-Pleurochrysis_carterae.AAC.3